MQAEFHLRRERENHLEYGRGRHARCGVHFHSQIEVYFVLEGEIEVWINDKHRVLRSGEMSVAFSYDAHGYREVRASAFAYLIIPTDLLHEFAPLFTESMMLSILKHLRAMVSGTIFAVILPAVDRRYAILLNILYYVVVKNIH